MRHRHTVEQYGVRVEIPTKAHRRSHSSARSYHTWHARGHVLSRLSDSGAGVPTPDVSMPDRRCPVKTANPPVGGTETKQRRTVPFRGAKDRALVTGRRDPGEPLGWPVRAFPIPVSVPTTPCRSTRFGPPASRSGSPPDSGEPVERVSALRRPPRVLDSPLRLVHQKRCF